MNLAPTVTLSGRPVGRPTTDTLTDRYVWAVLRSLPEAKRLDIDRELRASIADDVDARVELGESPAAAEHAVLRGLGEPAALAASYMGRPLALIGPDLYLDYVRLLKMLAIAVVPIVAVVHFAVRMFTGAGTGEAIGSTAVILVGLVVHLAFWTTLVFVIVERSGAGASMRGVANMGRPHAEFDPADLAPVPTGDGASRADLIASLVFLALVPIAVLWQQFSSVVEDADGSPVPALDPALWSFWLPYFLVLVVVQAVAAVVLYRTGRWTIPLVIANAVITLATTVPLAWIVGTGQLLNPAFTESLGWGEFVGAGTVSATVTVVAIVVIAVWSVADSAWKAHRAAAARRATD